MSRNTGTFNFAANFEGLSKAPIDARQVVGTYADLTGATTWNASGNIWLYDGAIVAVGLDPILANNGVYFLKDATGYTNTANWIKLAEGLITTTAITGATNGLTKVGQDVKLGGTTPLSEATNICGADYALCLGTAASKLGAFQINAASVAILTTGTTEICPTGALTLDGSAISVKSLATYDASYASSYTAQSIPDAGYVTGLTSQAILTANNGLTKVGTNAVLGGALTGNTSLTGAHDLSFSHTNINLTGSTAINLGGEVKLKSTPASFVGDILTYDSSDGAISKTTLASLSGLTGATNGIGTTGQNVCLGGALVANTAITGDYDLCLGTNASCLNTLQIYTEENITIESDNNLIMSLSGGTITTSDLKGLLYGTDYIDTFIDNSLVSKLYVDTVATGLDPKSAVNVATTVNIVLSGLTTIDGYAVQKGDRVLVKNQTSGETNGIYDVVSGASWTRSSDFDGTEVGEVTEGALIPVLSGSTQINTSWILITKNPITIGTTPLVFTKFSQLLDVAAGAGIAISTVGETKTICVCLGSNSGLNTSSGLVVDSSIAGNALSLTTGVLNVNAASCGSVGAIPVGYNTGDCLVVATSDMVTALGTPINTANNGLTKIGSNVVLGGALTGATTISLDGSDSLKFSDTRGTTVGIEYSDDYSAEFADNSLITKKYVTSQVSGITSCAITTANNGLTKSGQNVYLGGTLTGSTLIETGGNCFCFNDNSSCNFIEMNPTVPNVRLGQKDLSGRLNSFSIGATGFEAYTECAANFSGFYYANCFATDVGNMLPNSIPDVKWVTGCTSTAGIQTVNNGLTKVGTNAVLGGALTGNTTINLTSGNLCFNGGTVTNQFGALGTILGYNGSCLYLTNSGDDFLLKSKLGSCFIFGNDGIHYGGDYSGNYVARSIPDAAWVTGQTSTSGIQTVNNGLTKVGTNAVLGGALTGDTTISGAHTLCLSSLTAFNATATNISLTGIVGITGAVNISGAIDGNSTLDILGATELRSTLDVTGATAIGGVVTLTSVATGSVSTDEVMLITSGGEIKKVAGDTLGEDNNIYSKTIVTGATTGTTASTYVQLISGATTFTLPASPQDGQAFKIKDACGNALAAPITIDASSGLTIDGSQCALINTDYGALELVYGATNEWFSLAFVN